MGFVIGILIGTCAVGLETCLWLRDHFKHEDTIKALNKSIAELRVSVINLVDDKKELIRRLDSSREANEMLRKQNDNMWRELQAKNKKV